MNVLITGTGRESALGFNFVRRYLEHGDHVIATVRKQSEALEKLQKQWPNQLDILTMDIGSTESVQAAAQKVSELLPHLDLIINNAVITSQDYKEFNSFEDSTLDWITDVVNVSSVGPLRVIQAMEPMLYKCEGTAMVVNISSNNGSLTDCKTDRQFDYYMCKAALNMGTKILYNKFSKDKKIRMLCIHPGWMRTNPGNEQAPFIPYDHAERMRLLFETRRESFDDVVFVDYNNDVFPW